MSKHQGGEDHVVRVSDDGQEVRHDVDRGHQVDRECPDQSACVGRGIVRSLARRVTSRTVSGSILGRSPIVPVSGRASTKNTKNATQTTTSTARLTNAACHHTAQSQPPTPVSLTTERAVRLYSAHRSSAYGLGSGSPGSGGPDHPHVRRGSDATCTVSGPRRERRACRLGFARSLPIGLRSVGDAQRAAPAFAKGRDRAMRKSRPRSKRFAPRIGASTRQSSSISVNSPVGSVSKTSSHSRQRSRRALEPRRSDARTPRRSTMYLGTRSLPRASQAHAT